MRMIMFFTTHFVWFLHILHIWGKQSGQELEIRVHLYLKPNLKLFVNYCICTQNNIDKPNLLNKSLETPPY